jgi:hypothetical protein
LEQAMALLNLAKSSCLNSDCDYFREFAFGNIKRCGSYPTKQDKRKRLGCKICIQTFSTTKGTAYYRLKNPKKTFDAVAQASIEGVNKFANARVNNVSPSTVWRWLIVASNASKSFNDKHLKG